MPPGGETLPWPKGRPVLPSCRGPPRGGGTPLRAGRLLSQGQLRLPGILDVLPDLPHQLLDAFEFSLVPDAVAEMHGDLLPVDVAMEVPHVDLDAQGILPEGRVEPDACDRTVQDTPDLRLPDVYARKGNQFLGEPDDPGKEPQRLPPPRP